MYIAHCHFMTASLVHLGVLPQAFCNMTVTFYIELSQFFFVVLLGPKLYASPNSDCLVLFKSSCELDNYPIVLRVVFADTALLVNTPVISLAYHNF